MSYCKQLLLLVLLLHWLAVLLPAAANCSASLAGVHAC
jgi:hypothetical protein